MRRRCEMHEKMISTGTPANRLDFLLWQAHPSKTAIAVFFQPVGSKGPTTLYLPKLVGPPRRDKVRVGTSAARPKTTALPIHFMFA